MTSNLPTDVDSSYPDRSPGDAAHQQHHDILHALNNVFDGAAEGQRFEKQGGELVAVANGAYPQHWAVSGDALVAAHNVAQGTWIHTYSSGYHTLSNGTSNTDGDSITIPGVRLAAGTYTLRMGFRSLDSGGIVDIDVGGTEVASIDTYAASTANDASATTTGITIAADGVYDVTLRLDGQNASSVGHRAYIEYIGLVRTGA